MLKLHLGTLGWSYNFWRGNFYPAKTASKDFLSYYSSKFNTVEVDSTFYRIPSQETVQNWHSQTPKDFLFSLKFPQLITHIRMLKDCQPQTDAFLSRAVLLKEKLGPLLLQFPPSFTSKHMEDLAEYLHKLPKGNRYVVEVRNKTWLTQEFYGLLRECGVALAWTSTDLMAEVREVTGDFLYMRWEGDRQAVNGTLGKVEVDRAADTAAWAQKLKAFLAEREFFGYFAKYYSGFPPIDVANMFALLTGYDYSLSKQKQLLSTSPKTG